VDIVALNAKQAHLLIPKKDVEDEIKDEELKAIESEPAAEEPASFAAEEPEAPEKPKYDY
jgi:hypothetical protein